MNSLSSYILVPELVYKHSWSVFTCTRAGGINSLGSYLLVPELVYKQSWFVFTCTRAGV